MALNKKKVDFVRDPSMIIKLQLLLCYLFDTAPVLANIILVTVLRLSVDPLSK